MKKKKIQSNKNIPDLKFETILIFWKYLTAGCLWMLDAILEYTTTGYVPSVFLEEEHRYRPKSPSTTGNLEIGEMPKRMEGSHLNRHSKVLESEGLNGVRVRSLPPCPSPILAVPRPLNESAPT